MIDHIKYFYKLGETGVWILFLWLSLSNLSQRLDKTEDKFMKAHNDVITEVRTMTASLQGVEKTLVAQAKDLDSGKERFISIEKKIEKLDNEFSLTKKSVLRLELSQKDQK